MRRSAAPDLPARLSGLRDALEAADGHLPPAALLPARGVLAKAGARTALGDATVVALAGATGSGKSSLFNALVGDQVSSPGVRRPTTGTAHGAVWAADGDDRAALLDWLGVPRRHLVPQPAAALDGLVLLDLPDHDSTRLENRLEVDRLVELVDVLVWVLDPQKYADAAVHDRYLRPLAGHAGVLLVVLNQADRLDDAAREACLADLRRLLDSEGLAEVPVLAVSARTGLGLPALLAEMEQRAAARRAATDRLVADVRGAARGLQGECGEVSRGGGAVTGKERGALVAALSDAAGVPAVVGAVEGSVRRRGAEATGWPALRWTGKLRADPLRRLHLSGPAQTRGRTSLVTGAVPSAQLSTALREVRDVAGAELSPGWRESLRRELAERETGLAERLDRAVAGTELGAEQSPRWWSGAAALQKLLLGVALVGALWLLLLVGLGALQLSDVVPLPHVAGFPLPTLLLVAGLLAGLLLAVLCRPLVRATARRRAGRARERLQDRVGEVADAELLGPLAGTRAAHDTFCQGLARAGG